MGILKLCMFYIEMLILCGLGNKQEKKTYDLAVTYFFQLNWLTLYQLDTSRSHFAKGDLNYEDCPTR